jgi:hypothetical protein
LNQLPYTPFGLELYKSHKALEGADAVRPAEGNDPRNLRVIWTDGRELPTLVDGAVDLGGEIREQRFFGYSVGR